MPFDTTNVAATTDPQPAGGPLQTLSQLAMMQNALNQNRMFQAQQAAGQDLQGAVGPDGTVNQNAFMSSLGADPRASVAAMEAARGGAALQGQNISNTTGNLANAGARVASMKAALGAVPKGSNPDQYMAVLNQGVAQGLWTGDDAATVAGGNAPEILSLADQAKMAAIQSGNPAEQTAQGANIVNVNTGGAIQPTVQNPYAAGGATSDAIAGASIPTTLTPAERNTPAFQRYNPTTHQMETVTQAQAAANPPAGPIPAAPPLGAEAQASAAAAGAVAQGQGIENGIVSAALDSPQRRATLGTVIGLSKELNTGPNSDFWKGLGQLGAEYGIQTPITPAPGETAAREALDKLGWQVAQRQFQVLGGTGSNQQLDSAVSTSPHSSMSAQGIQNISGFLQGNEDAIQAQAQALQKWKAMPQNAGHPENNARFVNVWNGIYDPRAFQMKYEDANGKAAMLAGMKPAEQAEFVKRQKLLTDMGYLGQ